MSSAEQFKTVKEYFDHELTGYKKGKGSVQFPIDTPLPKQLIIRMVTYRQELLKIIEPTGR
jgi:uncharacterized protein YdhG (YjbR/CyaY superfamily)